MLLFCKRRTKKECHPIKYSQRTVFAFVEMHLIHVHHSVAFMQTLHTDIWYIVLQQNTSRGVTDLFVILPTLKQPMCVYILLQIQHINQYKNNFSFEHFYFMYLKLEMTVNLRRDGLWLNKFIWFVTFRAEDLFGFRFPKEIKKHWIYLASLSE